MTNFNAKVWESALVNSAVFVTFALALHYQGEEVRGVPDSAKSYYRHIKQWFDEHFSGSN
jgi:hypothetical protein